MWPSRRIIRFFVFYGIILFLLDYYWINPSRGWLESLIFVALAVIIALLVYPLFRKGYKKVFGKGGES